MRTASELHAGPIQVSADKEFRNPHRVGRVARTYSFIICGLADNKYTVYLHMESKGKVLHLHAAICRFDENGNINNDHNIHLRAQRAAERVAMKCR